MCVWWHLTLKVLVPRRGQFQIKYGVIQKELVLLIEKMVKAEQRLHAAQLPMAT